MSLASTAIRTARVYLNDLNGTTWGDHLLMPLLQEAHGELIQELELNNTGNLKYQTQPITVPALATTLGTDQPTNIINPISIIEGNVGDDPDSFRGMIKVSFIPYEDQTDWLGVWAWIGQVITFLGATVPKQIILRYEGSLTVPQTLNDPLGVIFAERYIGPRIASLACLSIGRDNSKLQDTAEQALYKLIQSQVVNDQRPTRRRGYRSRKHTYGPNGVGTLLTTQGGASLNFAPTSTNPDGNRTTFTFPMIPKHIIWNGLWLEQNKGYTLSIVSGQYTVSFIDVNGNVLTPDATDIIEEVW